MQSSPPGDDRSSPQPSTDNNISVMSLNENEPNRANVDQADSPQNGGDADSQPPVAEEAPPPPAAAAVRAPRSDVDTMAADVDEGSGSDVDALGLLVTAEENIETKAARTQERIEKYSSKRSKRSLKLAIARAIATMDKVGAGSGVEFSLISRLAESITVPRLVALVICWLQLFFVFLPTVIISAQHRDTVVENVRTLCLVVAGAFTVVAASALKNVREGPASQCFEFLTLKMFSFVFEVQMFAIANDWPTLFVFGILSGLATIVAWVLILIAFLNLRHVDPGYTELQYTRYAARRHINATVAMVVALRKFATRRGNMAHASQEEADVALMVEASRLSKVAAEVEHEALVQKAEEADAEAPSSIAPAADGGENPLMGAGQMHQSVLGSDAGAASHRAGPDEAFRKTLSRIDKSTSKTTLSRGITRWYAANRIRKALFQRDTTGNRVMSALLLVLFVACLGTVAYEFAKIFANQPPLFSSSLNDRYNKAGVASFGATRSHSAWKVHVVVVDGLRYDMTDAGASAIGDLVATPAFAANSFRLKMLAQLPSFSVPNWMTMLSGAPPEQTGITGNLLSSETSYDHVYRQCEKFGLHSGLTGTPWWRNLIFSSVPTLDGDGTIWSDYFPQGTPDYAWDTSNPADEARLNVALTAAVRARVSAPFGAAGATSLYELFLTHFSDVDKQGHEYGVDTEFNTRNTYMGAIANKTAAIQQIINAMDSQTVLIITSDHGHVKRGGHGGVSRQLLEVPIIFYTKSAALSAATPVAFPADAGPRFGEYQNTDLAATISALLGIPAPRQSTGIFLEEIVRALVPAAAQLKHYDDLMRARYSLVEEMLEHIGADFWGNLTKGSELEDPEILALKAMTTPTGTPQQYGDAIRKLDGHYQRLRDNLALFDLMRNLIASLFMLVPGLLFILAVAENLTIASLSSIFDRNSRCRQPNLVACIKGFVTVFLHIALSLAVFLIGYFGVTGYSVWDSTLTHTPSVAVTFLSRTVVAPVFIFVLLTRAFLFTSIRWYSLATIREFKEIFMTKRIEDEPAEGTTEPKAGDESLNQSQAAAAEPLKFTHLIVIGWIGNAIRDVIVFVFGTSRYRRAAFADAYLYLYYVAMWSAVAAFLLLFMCFPFSFMVPVVFAIPYVNEFNAEWRFRMITMLMLVLPLLVGTALLLYLRPKLDANTVLLWDQVLLDLDMSDEVARLRSRLDSLVEDLEEELAKTGDERKPERIIDLRMQQRDVRGRIKLAARAAGYVMDSTFAFTEDSLPESKLFRDDDQKADQRLFDGNTEELKKALVY